MLINMSTKILEEGIMNSWKKSFLGEWIAGVSGLAFIIIMFIRWFSWSPPFEITTSVGKVATPRFHMTAFESFPIIGPIFLFAAIIAISFAFLSILRSKKLPAFISILVVVLGLFIFVFILKNIIILPNLKPSRGSVTILSGAKTMREIGIFLGLVASLGITVGGLLSKKQK